MKTISFGDPHSDARYLVGGFSAPVSGRRRIGQVARMRLFPPPGQGNRLVLRVRHDRPQHVDVLLNGQGIGGADVVGHGGAESFELDVPAELAAPESVLELRCREPHPLDAHVPRCLDVEALEVAEWCEPEASAAEAPECGLYFGDVHVHSNLSPCRRPNSGSLDENYTWAREDGWDFVAIADHDTFMSDGMWRESLEACERHDDPGRFATLFAYEWTSFFYGQMNVYSPSPDVPLHRCTDYATDSPPKLWRTLKGSGVPCFTISHHMAAAGWATTWDYYDPDMLPLVEIYSIWRSSERPGGWSTVGRPRLPGCTAQDALARGLRVGFIGGGDTHLQRPGERGIAGVYAAECTRQAVWDALRAKRCYATTGARIELEFSVAGVGMGGEIAFTPYTQDTLFPCPVRARVKGTAPIRSIEVVENGHVIYEQPDNYGLHEVEIQFTLEHPVRRYSPLSVSIPSRSYYVRVTQQDGHMAWSSPVHLVRDWSGIE